MTTNGTVFSLIFKSSEVILKKVGVEEQLNDIVVLHVQVEGNKVNFGLELNPDPAVYKLDTHIHTPEVRNMSYGHNAVIGKPWGYADRKMMFGNLQNPTQLTFWANELEFTVYNTAPNFEDLVSILKS